MGIPGGLTKGSDFTALDAAGQDAASIFTSFSSILAILAGGGREDLSGLLTVLNARATFTSGNKMQARSFVLPESTAVLRCTN
jgi:hypothetical protein